MTANGHPPHGFGSLPRKEDARLIRGQGRFVDDLQPPGLLHGAVLRSPLAHARLVSIDISAALAHPRVHAVLTGRELEQRGMAWMPTLSGDVQAVLATDKVRFHGQEVAFVVADDRYSARDALELIEVEYEQLEPVVDPRRALDPGAPVIRDDLDGRRDNHLFDWETGDRELTERTIADSEVVVSQELIFPRSHPAPMETCAAMAEFDRIAGRLTIWCTTQAPHAHRTMYAGIMGLPEHRIRVVSPDVGGGFGNKVPLYPGYVCAAAAAIALRRPVKWTEDRSENLMSTGFSRDYRMRGTIAADADGRIRAVQVQVLADHGAFNATAQPSRFPAGFFGVFCGSYELLAAHCQVRGVYTNKAPGGVAHACSFRVAEAVYAVERLVDLLASRLRQDPAQLRMRNLIESDRFPFQTATGWVYDSGDYQRTLRTALDLAGYEQLRAEQAHRRARGELVGIGLSCFTEAVGAGPRRHMDILGLGMNDGAALRISPTGTAQLAISVQTQGQGHETTFAQIVAHELGIDPADVDVIHGDTDATPYGLGTYGSRSTPVSGAATALVARRVRDRARIVAAAMLEVAPGDLVWEQAEGGRLARWCVRGDPEQGATIAQIAAAARGTVPLPEGIESGLDSELVYDPPNLTFPFGAYLCLVSVDPGTGKVRVERFVAVDDCGIRINPMIVEGQIHGGLTDGVGIALMEAIGFDEHGNCLGGSLMDYLLPTALEVPDWETGETVTPSPHHPLGAKGIGESATVGSPPAIVNAICDALAPLGVSHVDMPCTPGRVWDAIRAAGDGKPTPATCTTVVPTLDEKGGA
ncbi:MAG: aerobic carbon-monoxide dehydrogenase large subunit [Solirubrobacteraceae bacterium]